MWAIVAMLGIMKAGCAFVPLDPKYPPLRVRQILEQTRATVVVSATGLTESFALPNSVAIILLGCDAADLASINMAWTPPACDPSDPAYLIFTSGSTGIPKGVILQHSAASTSCMAHGPAMGFEAGQALRVLQFSSYVFDGCIMEIFTTLIYGGCIVVPSEAHRSDYELLTDFMSAKRVNWAFLTPSLARCIPLPDLRALDVFVVGGEVLTESDRKSWSQLERFIVAYGPTETCVICCTADYSTGAQSKATIGRAIKPGWRSWIVDPQSKKHRLLPIGAVGELIIEGYPLTSGYLNDTSATSDAFINSPDWLPGARLYKTGDLVRYNPDGTMSFIGRKDQQVKVNGQRVEVGEIEQHLRQCLPKAVAVVVEPIKLQGQPSFVLAVFIRNPEVQAATDIVVAMDKSAIPAIAVLARQVGTLLSERLPSYMVPTLYIPLTRIPLTVSGKADRRQLQHLASNLSAQQIKELRSLGQVSRPTTHSERLLSGLWSRVLNIDETDLGTESDFFRSGGDSILAMKLVSLARSHGLPLRIKDVFTYPTISSLAQLYGEGASEGNVSERDTYAAFSPLLTTNLELMLQTLAQQLGVELEDVADAFPATPIQREFISEAAKGDMPAFNYIRFDFDQSVCLERLQSCCQQLVDRFDTLRTVFTYAVQGLVQVVLKSMTARVVLHEAPPEDDFIKAICEQDQRQAFAPHEPLNKFFLVYSGERIPRRIVMIVRLSHAQYDGIAINMLHRALQLGLSGSTLPEAVPFSRFVQYVIKNNPHYYDCWRQRLRGSVMSSLPRISDKDVRPGQSHDDLVQISQSVQFPVLDGITPATIFGAAWALVLAKMCGSSDIVYGLVVAGRSGQLPNIHYVFGPCINKVPIRVRTDTSKIDLLRAVQYQQASSGEADLVSLQEIIEHCTDWSHDTTFGSVIQYQNPDVDATVAKRQHDTFSEVTTRWVDLDTVPGPGLFLLCSPTGNTSGCSDTQTHVVELTSNRIGVTTEAAGELLEALGSAVQSFALSCL
jgi:amino acid adenylation domain-containing protein